jgi:hypothetical protein
MDAKADVTQTAAERISLTEIQKSSLKCARKLLQADPVSFGLPDGWHIDAPKGQFYETVLAAVESLTPEARKKLREDVEWVLSYDENM